MTTTGDGTHNTSCPMDCPDTCALEVQVVEGRVTRIGGRRDHPDTAGFICGKIANFARRLEHEDRILYPMRRVGAKGEGRFSRISWDEAISEIAEKYKTIRDRWGGEAIVPFHYGGSNGLLTDSLIDALFFDRLGASRLDLTICAAPTTAVAQEMYGRMPGVAFADYPEARCIVIWGANPKASNIHLVPYLREAKRRGCFIATVDPRQNFSDSEVDLHLPVRPGADLPVALAMIGIWHRKGQLEEAFLSRYADGAEMLLAAAGEWTVSQAAEVADVEASQIERLADIYEASDPAVIRCGWGLERNRNGGQAVAAVLAMPALLGKFGQRGGGYTMSNGGASHFEREQVIGELVGHERRSFNMTQLARWLNQPQEPPIKSLFVYNANPIATVPDQNGVINGMKRSDLYTVVFDQVLTDTALYADLVLPAVTFLEGRDVRAGYGSYVLGGVRPVIPPMGEARTNASVFSALGQAMGFEDPGFRLSEEELFERTVAAIDLNGHKPNVETVSEGLIEQHVFAADESTQPDRFVDSNRPVQFESVSPRTIDGKIHLTPAALGQSPYHFEGHLEGHSEGLPDSLPLSLISPASSKMISSTLGEYNYEVLMVELHPTNARNRMIEPGDRVRVFNDLGEVHCIADVSERVRPGVVSMPKGAWRKSALNGSTSTALCPDHVNVVAGGACFNDARVEVELLTPA
jgi:anaerobic selenocysteine-containing dehydrogenase